MAESVKIRVELHEGDKITTKIWRYEAGLRRQYSRERVEREIGHLYPHLEAKGMKVKMFHIDDLAGRIDIESDADMSEALENFVEEYRGRKRKDFITLHAEDCLQTSAVKATTPPRRPETKTECRKVR